MGETRHDPLEAHIEARVGELHGPWVAQNSAYEPALAAALGMRLAPARYWDAEFAGEVIEYKKGRSVWLDLVRYAEIICATTDDAKRPVRTLFFEPTLDRSRISRIACVETEALLKELSVGVEQARQLLVLRRRVPRSLNAQASLTWRDLARLASFVVVA